MGILTNTIRYLITFKAKDEAERDYKKCNRRCFDPDKSSFASQAEAVLAKESSTCGSAGAECRTGSDCCSGTCYSILVRPFCV